MVKIKQTVLQGDYMDYKDIITEMEAIEINPLSIKKIIVYYDEEED